MLLNVLGDCCGTNFPEDHNVWVRPFKYLIAYDTQIRQTLQKIESNIAEIETEPIRPSQAEIHENQNEVIPAGIESVKEEAGADKNTEDTRKDFSAHIAKEPQVEIAHAKKKRNELRCLVDFMDEELQDIFEVQHQIFDHTLQAIEFEFLWLLFKPGDLILSEALGAGKGMAQAYRVLHVTGGRAILDPRDKKAINAIRDRDWASESETEERAKDTIRSSSKMTPFMIDCFSIDCDGHRMGPKPRRFVISMYSDKRKVTSLEVYPAAFHRDYEDIQKTLISRGRRFVELATGSHKQYSGSTLRESKELYERTYHNYVINDEEVLIRAPNKVASLADMLPGRYTVK